MDDKRERRESRKETEGKEQAKAADYGRGVRERA